MGIAPRRFWGWEPGEVHTHELDADGRVVRTVVTREPEWDDESRALLLAIAEAEAGECPGCGQPLDECMSPEADPNSRAAGWGYEVGAPHRCHACSARERSVDAFTKAGGAVTPALRWPVRRVEREARG